jgi:hypothetical protein
MMLLLRSLTSCPEMASAGKRCACCELAVLSVRFMH